MPTFLKRWMCPKKQKLPTACLRLTVKEFFKFIAIAPENLIRNGNKLVERTGCSVVDAFSVLSVRPDAHPTELIQLLQTLKD